MGRVKASLAQLIGRTISAVVVTENDHSEPQSQLFLVFRDGTSFEFWVDGSDLSMASRIDESGLDEVVRIARERPGNKLHVFDGERKEGVEA